MCFSLSTLSLGYTPTQKNKNKILARDEIWVVHFWSEHSVKLSCDSRFQRAFTACVSVLKQITLVGLNQHNFFENETACSKRTLKTTVATQL